jgi:hypothetical protein
MRELFGQQNQNTSGLLHDAWMEKLLVSEIHIEDPVRCLYMAVDPGGGGPGELGVIGIVETISPKYGARLAVIFSHIFSTTNETLACNEPASGQTTMH